MWFFNLQKFEEKIRILEYNEHEHNGIKTHADVGTNGLVKFRKLTVIVQLSDENTYEGGNLTVQNNASALLMPRQKGTVIIFPSFLLHRVDSVTKGIRRSMVTHVHGPPFC